MIEKIKNLLQNLSQKERDVVILLFGLDGLPRSPEEIGALYGVETDRIIEIADQALSKMPVTIEELKSIAKQAQEEVKNQMAERKSKLLSNIDSELLNIAFFGNESDEKVKK